MTQIKIQTNFGELSAKPAYEIKEKHWRRMNEIVSSVKNKKKRKTVKIELICFIFTEYGLKTVLDNHIFFILSPEEREKTALYWYRYSKAVLRLDYYLENFAIESQKPDEAADK